MCARFAQQSVSRCIDRNRERCYETRADSSTRRVAVDLVVVKLGPCFNRVPARHFGEVVETLHYVARLP